MSNVVNLSDFRSARERDDVNHRISNMKKILKARDAMNFQSTKMLDRMLVRRKCYQYVPVKPGMEE